MIPTKAPIPPGFRFPSLILNSAGPTFPNVGSRRVAMNAAGGRFAATANLLGLKDMRLRFGGADGMVKKRGRGVRCGTSAPFEPNLRYGLGCSGRQ
jgi:hypothetical protein